MELDAVEGAAARPRWRSARRSRPCRARPARARARARRSARGRRRSARAGPPSAASPAARSATSFQPMCGSFSAAGSQRAHLAGHDARGRSAPPSSSEESKASCMPEADAEHGRAGARRARAAARRGRARAGWPSRAGTRRRRAARGRRPRAARSGSLLISRARADVLERLLDRAAVAHAVVDDRDLDRLRRSGAHAVSVPFVLGTPRLGWGRSRRPGAARGRTP